MKHILIIILFFSGWSATAQPYQNSWIKYGRPYYKFSVIEEGVYRIPQSVLQSAGLGNTPAEQFQLWRNGEEQPIYISKQTGTLGPGDFIEFYGVLNDGKPDNKLYRKPDFQLSDYYSLISDTSSYFLTVNSAGGNKQYIDAGNDVASNVLPAEKYFMNKRGMYFNTTQNLGYAIPVGGVYLYSAAYDEGEGWTSKTIAGATPPATPVGYATVLDKLNVYTADPSLTVTMSYAAAGSAFNSRNVRVKFNTTFVDDVPMPFMGYVKRTKDIPLTLFADPNKATVTFYNYSDLANDRMVVSYWDILYPSTFNFNNQTSFYFELPATTDGNYLEITNFNSGGEAPVLYDQTNLRRYVGDISQPGKVRFALPPSSANRKLRLVSETAGNLKTVASLKQRNFIDFSDPANQGDYIIISNPLLYTSAAGRNYVDDYRQYRNSANGGGFHTIVINEEELTDQFAYGISKHPLGIKEFIQFASAKFSVKPQYVFLIGKGVSYDAAYRSRFSAYVQRLNLVPTFGNPGSDNLLASGYGGVVTPKIPIGRLSAVSGQEVGNYLDKIKEYDGWQRSTTQTIDEKLWMKNAMQIIGGSTTEENGTFRNFMFGYKMQLEDTTLGMHVESFSKTANATVQLAASKRIEELFSEGIGMIGYFGHSSANTLEYNLGDPQAYNNPSKYPLFVVSGCTAGNNFTYDSMRIEINRTTISEDWVLSKNRGSIGFMASSHYGIPYYLNEYNTNLYKTMSGPLRGASIGAQMQQTIKAVGGDNPDLYYYNRADAEEMSLNGDPAIKVNAQPRPDYVVEDRLIKIDPSFVSVSNQKFTLTAGTYNLGKAVGDSITWEIKRTYPNGTVTTLYRQRRRSPYYGDSVILSVPIISSTDKGLNKITVTIDADNDVDEISESNNVATKEFYIIEDEASPVYPQNFAIINKDNEKMYASTANPLSTEKEYVFQIDTTELFNSALKVSKQIRSKGGIIEFDPGFNYLDSTVYYWRVMVKSDTTTEENAHWNKSNFIYIKNSSTGANQSGYFQHLYSDTQNIKMNTARNWQYASIMNMITARGGVYPTAQTTSGDFNIDINGAVQTKGQCSGLGFVFNVIDPVSLTSWKNTYGTGRFGSMKACASDRDANFHYDFRDQASRIAAYHFLKDSIPDGMVVVFRSAGANSDANNSYVDQWQADTTVLGSDSSIYHLLLNNGFSSLDSFNRMRSFIFMYQKGVEDFVPTFVFSNGATDKITLTHPLIGSDSVGFITSPKFGPALSWTELHWDGFEKDSDLADNPEVSVVGVKNDGTEAILATTNKAQKSFDLSSVNASEYPYMRLVMRNADSIHFQAYQLQYWRINYVPAPEGAIAPSLLFKAKDTLMQGEPLDFAIAFRNISSQAFDSVSVKINVIDKNNVTHIITVPRQKPLVSGDTIQLRFTIDTKDYPEGNTLYVEFNPDNDQPELNRLNNFIFYNFYVKPDVFNPLLDVTFDGVHILNRDIVSAKPDIVVKLKDENRFMRLSDTSLLKVQLKYSSPNGPDIIRTIPFNNDTLTFSASSGNDNTATINYRPQFTDDDNEYELIVSGKDVAGNKSGNVDYHVTFRVINKAMITELLNYPNPFTTSTAFVFTLTGSEIPQNLRIQILTVTGKIIREITKEELGPIHIGRNITEFKWDGTDMYGQPVANGVYLYRVLTNLNGKSLDKFNDKDYQLNPKYQFFKNGYGKMYLMR